MKLLSKPEELILISVWKLRENAYGVTIRNRIIQQTGMEWTIGSIYVPLGRLSKWGFLEIRIGEPTAERGGKRKKYYRLTTSGKKALVRAKSLNETIWSNLTDLEPQTGKTG